MEFTVSLDIDEKAIVKKMDNILDKDTRTQLQQLFADVIDPWTPFLTGQLSNDISVDENGVTYNVPYASSKYYGYAFHKEVHPLATSHWDQVAMEQGAFDIFEAKAKEIIIARVKELYG